MVTVSTLPLLTCVKKSLYDMSIVGVDKLLLKNVETS
jgi:hypothetical protein